MTLTELRYLVALAEQQHFGRAAEICCVSQPTLSMAIRKLEENLEVLLFERSKSGIRATTMGEQIIAQAQRIVAQADAITALAEADKDQLGGDLKLGAILSLGPYLLPQLIPQLRLIAKSLRLDLYEGYTEDLRNKLRAGELDAILVAQPFSEQDIVTQDLYYEPLLLVMPPMHSLAARNQISVNDLNGQTFIVLKDGHCLREQMLAIFPQLQNEGGANIIESSSVETLRHMVAIGLGVSVLPSSAAISSTAHALTARPLQSAPTRKIALAWRASFPRHKAIDAVRRAIQTCSWQFTTTHNTGDQGLLVENSNW